MEFEATTLELTRCSHALACDESEIADMDFSDMLMLLPPPQKFPRQPTKANFTNDKLVSSGCSIKDKNRYKLAHHKLAGQIIAQEECGRWTCDIVGRAKSAYATAILIAEFESCQKKEN
jgi:hypothetical protein